MKLGSVTKIDKINIKKIGDDIMSGNCNFIIIFPIYGQFGPIWKPESGRIVFKIYIFINSNLLRYKN